MVRQCFVDLFKPQQPPNRNVYFRILYIAIPHQGDHRLSGPPSGQGVGGEAEICVRRVPADGSPFIAPPTPQMLREALVVKLIA
ncbi:hypothetical protein PoB_007267300 [Plakobranchus ocellatus]|uniref:Uncharacterized protein n=1 Tax=Plakobranchus ocellatus TaxID=259542 RepID=A0AAV4DPD5_9GAST|nr:hypothetical protein PoB_007267300 [Plakobranchus ocellatus]